MNPLEFLPIWLRVTHLFNFFFIILMIRSGIQILAEHPKLYWNDDSMPGTEWLKFGKQKIPEGKLWTSKDEAIKPTSLALPGGYRNLGPGRRWHFLIALSWMLNGFVYVILLFVTGMWRRLIPTDFSIFPRSWETFVSYLHFQVPPEALFTPFDPLQQLAYAGIVFVVAPLLILTALAMSPAVIGRFPWYAKLFGGRQAARSLHFLSMSAILAFIVIHVTLVFIVHYPSTVNSMVLGDPGAGNGVFATLVIIGTVIAIIAFNVWITLLTVRHERGFQLIADRILDPLTHTLLGRLPSRQRYTKEDISPFFRVNGLPPTSEEYKILQEEDFKEWKLRVSGLVHRPLNLSLEELKKLPKEEIITKHNCIQGWSAIAEWGGVSLSRILDLAQVESKGKFVVFIGYDFDELGRNYHEALTIAEARMPQTILAYEMNGVPLPVPHGAPLRLRAESRLGYKMVKYIKEIRIVSSHDDVVDRVGGTHEKLGYYDNVAAI